MSAVRTRDVGSEGNSLNINLIKLLLEVGRTTRMDLSIGYSIGLSQLGTLHVTYIHTLMEQLKTKSRETLRVFFFGNEKQKRRASFQIVVVGVYSGPISTQKKTPSSLAGSKMDSASESLAPLLADI
ncbi:hypothetical protein CBL_04921 [Carabus blaptoides fortunei]